MRKNVFPITAGVFGSLALAGMGSLLVTGTASAGLIDVTIEVSPNQHPMGDLWDTWLVVAHFDNLKDQIAAVAGLQAQALLFFTGGGDMYNQDAFAGFPLNDFPSTPIGGEAYDSYVTIGATAFPHNTLFSPDFLGDWGKEPPPVQVILGSSFGPESNGAWFFFGDPASVGTWGGNVIVAQFTVPEGVGFHLEGNIAWRAFDDPPGTTKTPFVVDNIPAPGAMALLGLAGLAGARRRRRRG
ncbi:MAG: PEP-CTERM sorting domain-containing protein [Phycisphaerae bacterium]